MSVVAVQKTKSDDYAGIKAAVDRVLEDLGGLSDIVKPGYKVLVKPNLVAVPTSRLSGAVTRWEVCLAVCEAVRAAGGEPFVAESACAGADTGEVIEFCGYDALSREGVPVLDLKDGTHKTCDIPVEGLLHSSIPSWEVVRDADAIITVPVMKTHDQTEVTVGMKNCKGLLPDREKKNFHAIGLVDSVTDLIRAVKPVLSIVDATYCQEGLGPVWGRTRRMDLVLGSKDLVACDAIAGLIMGYRPEEVRLTVRAHELGLGEMDPEKIEVRGVPVAEVATRFQRSKEVEIEGIPTSFRIVFDEKACTGCRNTLISALMDMKNAGLLGYCEGMTALCGPVTEDEVPGGTTAENTICVGLCAKESVGDKLGLRCALGCPPRNARAVQAILGDRAYYPPYADS